MDNDDEPVGRILSRREVLKLLGAAGATVFVAGGYQVLRQVQSVQGMAQTAAADTYLPIVVGDGAAATATPTATAIPTATPIPSCVVRPQQTEGPYFVDELLNRSDIRSDPGTGNVEEGVLLQLAFNVSQINSNGCTALEGAQVDVWHCNALGVYSDVGTASGLKFLRGYQLTNANGLAQFTTIYPGWYTGRTVHIHFKIRVTVSGQNYEFTSQLYFDDTLTDQVHALQPYASHGVRDTRNNADGIYQNGGSQLLLTLTPVSQGYTTTFDIALQI